MPAVLCDRWARAPTAIRFPIPYLRWPRGGCRHRAAIAVGSDVDVAMAVITCRGVGVVIPDPCQPWAMAGSGPVGRSASRSPAGVGDGMQFGSPLGSGPGAEEAGLLRRGP